jgi:hypothetical protein
MFIPVKPDSEIYMAARRFTEGAYRSLRVNLNDPVYGYWSILYRRPANL